MIQDKRNSQLSKNFQWKCIVNWLFFCKSFRQGICKNAGILTEPFSGMVKGISLWRKYRVRQGLCSASVGAGQVQLVLSILWEGYRERSFPVQVKGGSHCPVELMLASARTGYCLTLKSAGLAAKLPFSQAPLWEKMSGTALSPACREHAVSIA